MRKGILAFVALTGATLTASGAMLKVNDQTFANFGIKMQIYGQSIEDAANNGGDNAIDFTIQNARVYFSGQLNKIVQFGANLDFTVTGKNSSHEGTSTTKVRDAFINFHFMNELNVMAGYYRVPFSRETLTDRYNRVFMPQDGWVNVNNSVYKDELATVKALGNTLHLTASNVLGAPTLGNALTQASLTDESDFARDAGVTIWGDVLGGMVKYYVGVYDSFGDHNVGEALGATTTKDNLGYVIRLQFTPTMLGFKPETGYLLKETYLGKKDTMSIGLAYAYSKLDLNNSTTASSFEFKSWVIDFNYEQKFGVFVPKLEAGYVYHDADDLPLYEKIFDKDKNETKIFNIGALDKVKTYYISAGVLYDQKLFLGKLGDYLKYQKTQIEATDRFNLRKTGYTDSIEPSVWTVAIPYYLADQNAKIVLQWNHYDYDINGLDPRNADDDTNDDWTLAFQVQF